MGTGEATSATTSGVPWHACPLSVSSVAMPTSSISPSATWARSTSLRDESIRRHPFAGGPALGKEPMGPVSGNGAAPCRGPGRTPAWAWARGASAQPAGGTQLRGWGGTDQFLSSLSGALKGASRGACAVGEAPRARAGAGPTEIPLAPSSFGCALQGASRGTSSRGETLIGALRPHGDRPRCPRPGGPALATAIGGWVVDDDLQILTAWGWPAVDGAAAALATTGVATAQPPGGAQ